MGFRHTQQPSTNFDHECTILSRAFGIFAVSIRGRSSPPPCRHLPQIPKIWGRAGRRSRTPPLTQRIWGGPGGNICVRFASAEINLFELRVKTIEGDPNLKNCLYEALQDGSVQRDALLIYCQQIPHTTPPLLAGEHPAWPRLHAPTLRERTVECQPNAILQAKPITGARLFDDRVAPENVGHWALLCLHERIAPTENPHRQSRRPTACALQRLPQRPARFS